MQVDKADPPYPRSTSVWWFDCQSASSEDLSKASLTVGVQKTKIFIGNETDYHDHSTMAPTGGDYIDEETVDGSEKQDVELQNAEEGTPVPRQEALDGNSANVARSTTLCTSFIVAFILNTLRIRYLWL